MQMQCTIHIQYLLSLSFSMYQNDKIDHDVYITNKNKPSMKTIFFFFNEMTLTHSISFHL